MSTVDNAESTDFGLTSNIIFNIQHNFFARSMPGGAHNVGPAAGLYDPMMDPMMGRPVVMAAKSILNKLTMANITKPSSDLCELHITEAEELTDIVSIIFSKAIEDESACQMYAMLCNIIKDKMPEFQEGDPMLVNAKIKKMSFNRYLLQKCQKEFERAGHHDKATDAEVAGMNASDQTATLRCVRVRMLGNVKFIGELFRQEILNDKIMHDCIKRLLASKDKNTIECLCKLIATIGKQLDRKEAKLYMDYYFEQMQATANETDSQRLKTLLLDTLDLRKNRFVACFVCVNSYFITPMAFLTLFLLLVP